ncbi:MAG: serine/threonine protein kinase, partial [Undibacterium sp.]|nr:serine/threonine protein kinase [Undibacterium sp.]
MNTLFSNQAFDESCADVEDAKATSVPCHDFAQLSPDTVFDAMHAAGYQCDGRLLALNSYENRVYQLGVEDAPPLVVKFYRPRRWTDAQILEEHAFVDALHQAEIPAVPALRDPDGKCLQQFGEFRFAVFPCQGGRAPELDRVDTVERLGRFIARLHAVGALQPYQHRPSINCQSFGRDSLRYLLSHHCIPGDILPAYQAAAELMLKGVDACYERAGDVATLRLHGDCHMGNVLWTETGAHPGPHFVDFDDSRMGPAIQDLWMLLSGSRIEMQNQMCDIVTAYEEFYTFNPRELHLI